MQLFTQQNRHMLYPFEPIIASNLSLDGWAAPLSRRRVQIEFRLHDEQQQVAWPYHHGGQTRTDTLNGSSYFEVFLQHAHHPHYVNVQITPQGLWNAYRFDHYRHPKHIPPLHEQHIGLEHLQIEHHRIQLVLDLARLYPRDSVLRVGLAAVLVHPHDLRSIWSLQHSGDYADSHQASDWRIQFSLLD